MSAIAVPNTLLLGDHVLGDLSGMSADTLKDAEAIERVMRVAALAAGARVLSAHFHRFGEGGVTGVLLLAESHISVHTWPEFGSAAIDVFMCGAARANEAAVAIADALGAIDCRWQHCSRRLHCIDVD